MAVSTGCDDPQLAEDIYSYFAQLSAWQAAPGSEHALQRLRDGGAHLTLFV